MNKAFPLPVRVIGPGSQPTEDEEIEYLSMPRGMNTFQMPIVPEARDPSALLRARDVLATFLSELERWNPATRWQGPRVDLAGLSGEELAITNQMLGEGEVAIVVNGAQRYRIQESVFTGLWRVCALGPDDQLLADWLEAAPLPQVVIEVAYSAAREAPADIEVPAGAMNAPALLAEIRAQMAERVPGAAAHVMNLTLFPLTPEDHQMLERAVPVGPVAMMSRGFGNCHVSSTLLRGVWRVQYFNNMNTLILNTLEVVDVPEAALAATEDLEDSKTRLSELVAWMDESSAEQATS
jgi:hydrogenase-1 operon protein HyaF